MSINRIGCLQPDGFHLGLEHCAHEHYRAHLRAAGAPGVLRRPHTSTGGRRERIVGRALPRAACKTLIRLFSLGQVLRK
jgi:hypothetical protein